MLRDTILNILKETPYIISGEEAADKIMAAINGLPTPTGDAVSDWARISALHAPQEQAEQAMLNRVESALGITPSGRPEWITIARFLIEKEKDNETIETFAKNCKLDPYSTPKEHQIAAKPMLISANWKHVIGLSTPKDYTVGVPKEKLNPCPICGDHIAEDGICWLCDKKPLTAIEKAWQSALSQLETNGTLDKWMRDTKPLSWENGIFLVGVPTDYAREWLTQRLTSTVQRLLCGILNADVRVKFCVLDEEER